MIATKKQKFGLGLYAAITLFLFYFPILCIVLASVSTKRYFSFPYDEFTWKWYDGALTSPQVAQFVGVSLRVAGLTTVFSLIIGFFSALAYARYSWRWRKGFQRMVMLPLFFPQSVLGLALLMWFNFLNITPSWWTAVIGHTVWISPITTLIMAIQAYSLDDSLEEAARDMGATRGQILRMITLPLMSKGMVSAACFAVLLSWGNFALSLFTTGADSALPEWLYARMTSGYQPIVPAVGALSVLAAIIVLVVLFSALSWSARKQTKAPAAH